MTPGLYFAVAGNLMHFSPIVWGVFLIKRLPVLALDSGFLRFLGGPGSESNSKRQATSSVVKILPSGIVKRFKM